MGTSVWFDPPMTDTNRNHPGRLLTIEDVAAMLGVNVRHVRRLVFERRIPYVKWGHLLRFEQGAVTEFIAAHTRHPSAGPARRQVG